MNEKRVDSGGPPALSSQKAGSLWPKRPAKMSSAGAADRHFRQAIHGAIVAVLSGEAVDLSFVVLDTDRVPVFDRRVYEAARLIPPGATRTYGEVAHLAGARREARAVGQALGRNPFAIVVPCHRVVAANGRLGGFSAHGGVETKRTLLAIEGVSIPASVTLF